MESQIGPGWGGDALLSSGLPWGTCTCLENTDGKEWQGYRDTSDLIVPVSATLSQVFLQTVGMEHMVEERDFCSYRVYILVRESIHE